MSRTAWKSAGVAALAFSSLVATVEAAMIDVDSVREMYSKMNKQIVNKDMKRITM